jgi:hypothetical protein
MNLQKWFKVFNNHLLLKKRNNQLQLRAQLRRKKQKRTRKRKRKIKRKNQQRLNK